MYTEVKEMCTHHVCNLLKQLCNNLIRTLGTTIVNEYIYIIYT